MNKPQLIVLAVTFVCALGTALSHPHSEADAASHAKNAVPVEVTDIARRPLIRTLRSPGTLEAYQKADLFAMVSGYIDTVTVDIGSHVKKGDVLMTISVPELAADLRKHQAMAQAARARATFEQLTTRRQEQLAAEKAISQQDLDAARSRYAIAEADAEVAASDVARLETLLNYATIKAPFEGIITLRQVDPGAFVRSAAEGETKPLFALAKISKLRLVLSVPEPEVPFVRIGTDVDISLQCLTGQPIAAKIARTSLALTPRTRTMRAEVDLDNTSGQLAPGMYAQVSLKLELKATALLIPSKALRVRDKSPFVLVSRGGIAESCSVKTGYDDGIWVEILGGELKDTDQIIIGAPSAVAPGVPVKAIQQVASVATAL